jgi:hypothetical protein
MRIALSSLILGIMVATAVGQNKANSAAENTIRTLEREWTVGQSRNNIRVLDLIFDNNLIYVEYGRLVSKGEYLARIKQEAPQVAFEEMTVRIVENTAIVTGTYKEVQLHGGSRQSQRWCFLDTWVYKPQRGWTLVAAGSSPISK